MNKDDNAFLSELKTRMDFQAASIDAELAKQNALEAYKYYTDSVDNLNNIRMALGMDTSNKGYYQAKRGACLPKAEDGLTKEQIQEAANWMATNYPGEGSMAEEPGNIVGPQPDLASYALQNTSAQPATQNSSVPQIAYKPTKYSYQPVVTRFSTRPTKKITRDRAQRFDDFYGATRNNYDPNFYEVAKQNYMATGIDPNIEKRMNEDGRGLYRPDRFERRGWSPSVGMHYTGLVDDITASQAAAPAESPENTPTEQNTGLSPEVVTSTSSTNAPASKPASSSATARTKVSGTRTGQGNVQVVQTGKQNGTQSSGSPTSNSPAAGTINNPITEQGTKVTQSQYPTEFITPHSPVVMEEGYFDKNPYGVMKKFDTGYEIMLNGNRTFVPDAVFNIAQKSNRNLHSVVNAYNSSSVDNPYTLYDEDELDAVKAFSKAPIKKNLPVYINYKGSKYRVTNGQMQKVQYGGGIDVSNLVSQYNQLDENKKNEFLSKLGLI